MATNPPQPDGRRHVPSTLDTHIQVLDVSEKACDIPHAKAAFASAGILLTMIRDTMAKKQDYVDLGSTCVNVCKVLDRGLNGKRLDELSQSVVEAIQGLTTTVTEIQARVIKYGKRNAASRFWQVKRDKNRIVSWRQDLQIILHVFNTELLVNNHTILLDIRRDVQAGHGDANGRSLPAQTRIPLGELAPPPPKIFFGREDVIEKVVDLAENLASLALIGPGGIGKTSVALTVLHHDRIRERFGDDRRFIRCDQFPASRTNLLGRLSSVIGAGVENPEGLAPLRSFLSSREILIVLDNAESILDPQGTDGKGIYNVVKELSQFNNIFLLITSRITTIPPDFHCLSVPALSMDAARSTLHRIYDRNERPDLLDKILRQLDFHPLSVTLLATVARENNWDNDRLYREWEKRQTGVLRTEHNDSLAAAVELSLDSPMFKLLGPNAQELLGVIAFYPQGVGESADWLFTSIPNKDTILDKLCILSLTYRSNGYITMLAPLRDHFCPQDPESSPLLCATKELYFTRLIVPIDPNRPGFSDGRWIMSEDVNIEHLLDVFTSIDSDSKRVWDISAQFVYHLSWYKPRQTMLRSRIEELLDDHRSKPVCLLRLSELSQGIGNYAEQKRLLMHALKLNRERENDGQVANTLYGLSTANRRLGLYEEGIQQAKEALEIYERLGIVARKGRCSISLAHLLYQDNQLGAAEEVVLRTIKNLPEKGQESQTCDSHRLLGDIYRVNNEGEKALHHYNKALHIASSFDWSNRLGRTHHALAQLFHGQGKFDDAQAHIEQAKQHTADDPFPLSNAMELCAEILYGQERFEDARLEALRALEIYRKVGATKDMEYVRALLRRIDETEKA